jgi:drug/metabolite transporter (DMT)-like permease
MLHHHSFGRMPRSAAFLSAPFLAQLLLCSFLWATAFPLMKLIGTDIPPIGIAAVRGLLGALFLAGWFVARGQSLLPSGREWRDWMVLGLVQGAIPNAFTAYALTTTTTALASIIQATSPLLVALLAHLCFADERLTWARTAGILVGFAGIAVLIGPPISAIPAGLPARSRCLSPPSVMPRAISMCGASRKHSLPGLPWVSRSFPVCRCSSLRCW